MGSKKHKKDSKKKKHRSRSRSPLENEEVQRERTERTERKRHRKHKDRKRDRSLDVEEVPVDSHLAREAAAREEAAREAAAREAAAREAAAREAAAREAAAREAARAARAHSRSSSEERERRARELHRAHKDRDDADYHREKSSESSARTAEHSQSPPASRGSAHDSLSVDETNKLRAKLGLKPLERAEKPGEDGKIKDDLGEFYHKPAANIAHLKKSEKIREKLQLHKEKRKIEQKLHTTTLLGDESDEDDAAAWVRRSRDIDKQKRDAAKRAAMLDEMDEVFGVSALLEAEELERRQQSYSARELRGLRVAHDIDAIGDEREVVLTLADKDVLADDKEDVLVNVNIVDDERTKKNLLEAKKAKAGYRAYDDEAELEAASLGFARPVLSKYDDEINKDKEAKTRGFLIGDDDVLDAKKFRDMMRQERLQGGGDKRLESLQGPAPALACDYLDQHELQARFKKTKRKGKIRKKAKHEPIDVDDYDAADAPLDTDDTGDTEVKPELLARELAVDEEETEPDTELQAALARARRLRQAELAEQAQGKVPKVEEILERAQEEQARSEGSAMVLDATAEFCRTLGDIPTYGLAGNRDHDAEIMDFEREEELEPELDSNAGAWSRVDVHNEKPADLAAGSCVGLQAEPALGAGVWGALQLALSKGYLERAGAAPQTSSSAKHLLTARHYSIEDKTYGEDDKYGRRERGGHSGPLQDFREKNNFRPNIKLEYVDDDGRPLCPKEAFRYLSHKFHGKGPGKNKQEKRIKKAVQEGLMKKMSSTDTPLGTLQMLQDKQRETQSPYIVLSGVKRENAN